MKKLLVARVAGSLLLSALAVMPSAALARKKAADAGTSASAAVPAPASEAKKKELTSAGPVDLNQATAKQLEELPGVGKATSKKIIAGRPYTSVDDLSKAGVSAKVVENLRSLVTVSGAAPARVPSGASMPAPTPAPAASPAPRPAPAAPAAQAPAATPSPRASASKMAPGTKVNLNTATAEELDALPGIGPVKAKAIIEGRPYSAPEDVMKVKGIKQGEFAKIKDNITVN